MGITMSLDLQLFGERIRQARENAGLSQEQLALELKRDQRTISQYETGKRKVSITDLPNLALLLHVPIAYFFEGDAELDNYDARLLNEFHKLHQETDKSSAIELLRLYSDAIVRNQQS